MLGKFVAIAIFSAAALDAIPTRAQMTPTSPIIVHSPSGNKSNSGSTSSSSSVANSSQAWVKVEVLHADANSMVVSEQGNERVIHTFTYSDKVKTQMQKIIDKGGYQYGDKISIRYALGGTVALKIHGKPSKAS
jgi:hypothetical protein